MSTNEKPKPSHLVLGWTVTKEFEPEYWLEADARSGGQTDEHLVRVPADKMAAHTIIVAQSGSGKSFFLGRLIEEILLNTKARCLVLDPNADFRRVHEVKPESLWENASFQNGVASGGLPHEATRDEFQEAWARVGFRVLTGAKSLDNGPYEQLNLWWTSLSVASLSQDLEPKSKSDLYHCHAFVRALEAVLPCNTRRNGEPKLLDEAERIFAMARQPRQRMRQTLRQEYTSTDQRMSGLIEAFIERAATIVDYVTEDVQRFYFGRAREYASAGIVQTSAAPSSSGSTAQGGERRLEIVDLPSIHHRHMRLLALEAIVGTERDRLRETWEAALKEDEEADTRVPTFVVVDEAHNLMPAIPRGESEESLRERFRTIAAEGRKYGLFLILVTQRPDKLDPMIVSECENRAVMHLGSESVLERTRQMLGLEDVNPELLNECLYLGKGRVLLAGPWSKTPVIAYAAARRTIEGGRNLREQHWAVPYKPVAQKQGLVPRARGEAAKPQARGNRRRETASTSKGKSRGRL